MKILFTLCSALLLAGCADLGGTVESIGSVVSGDFLLKGSPLPQFKDYEGSDAARVRVIYNSAAVYVSASDEKGNRKWFNVNTGVKVNKQYMGFRWDWEPRKLGMPGDPPQYNYSEIAIPPGKLFEISFYWQSASREVVMRCNKATNLNPKANEDYQVEYVLEMDNSRCNVTTIKLSPTVTS